MFQHPGEAVSPWRLVFTPIATTLTAIGFALLLIWWLATAATTASGLALMVFVRTTWALLIGVALLIAPHLIGAALSPEGTGVVPSELAAAFAARSLVVNAVFWALLGLAAGALYERLGRTAKA
jgi:predicted cobalt transporter CbtA